MMATLVSLTMFAYPNGSKLTISTFNNQSIAVVIDGRAFQLRQNDNGYTINDLPSGYHAIRIYRQSGNYGRRRDNSSQVIYNGNIYVRNGYHTDITINRFGKAFVDEQMIGADYNNDDDRNRDYNNSYQPMSSFSFEQLRQSVAREPFDDTKLNIAKTGIAANLFSAAQAKQIIQLFSYDNSRLDIAKYLYKYTVDKNNYVTVYDAFSYSSSRDELSRFIQQYR